MFEKERKFIDYGHYKKGKLPLDMLLYKMTPVRMPEANTRGQHCGHETAVHNVDRWMQTSPSDIPSRDDFIVRQTQTHIH